MSSKILDAASSDGEGTAQTVTAGTTLLLVGNMAVGASVAVTIAPADATSAKVPFADMGPTNRSMVVPLGRADAQASINATLKGAGSGTSVTLYVL